MYVIVLGIFIIKLQLSVSDPQFPAHVDLQKVGEAIFNNEKFNILKTTTHVITDHFKEFMLRSGSSNHPAERVFIDNNGLRHEWSGFGEKIKSLRKTDLKYVSGSFENASENTPKSDTIVTDGNLNIADTVEDTNNDNVSSKNPGEKNEDEDESVQNLTKENNETDSKETTTTINLVSATIEKISSTDITIEKRLRAGEKDNKNSKSNNKGKTDDKKKDNIKKEEKKVDNKNDKNNEVKKADNKNDKNKEVKKADNKNDKNNEVKKADNKNDKNNEVKKADNKTKDKKDNDGKTGVDKNKDGTNKEGKKSDDKNKEQVNNTERTVMKTTFFCPYLGIISMSRFIDL